MDKYDILYEILQGKSMTDIADDFYDCFGDSWAEEEFDYCVRESVAMGGDDEEYEDLESLENIYEYMSLDDVMAHLSASEIENMLEYYGVEDEDEDEEEDDDDEYEDEEIYEDDIVNIYVDWESIRDNDRRVYFRYKNKGYEDAGWFFGIDEEDLANTLFLIKTNPFY